MYFIPLKLSEGELYKKANSMMVPILKEILIIGEVDVVEELRREK